MKVMVFAFLVVLLAISVIAGFAQEYDGQYGGQDKGNGGCKAIELPQDQAQLHQETVPEEQIAPASATEVGGHAIMHDSAGEPRGFSPAVGPTTLEQDRAFKAFAEKYGLLGRSDARALGEAIFAKNKAYTDKKDRAINARVTKLGGRVKGLEGQTNALSSTVGDKNSGLVKQANDLEAQINNPENGVIATTMRSLDATNQRISGANARSWLSLIISIIAICIGCLAIIKKGYYWIAGRVRRHAPPTL